jgi:hypothetical protein
MLVFCGSVGSKAWSIRHWTMDPMGRPVRKKTNVRMTHTFNRWTMNLGVCHLERGPVKYTWLSPLEN